MLITGEEDGFTNVVSRGVTRDDNRPLRHRQFSSSTTTSSLRSGGAGHHLPCLSGFIDSWNPFPGTERYFDTPPSGGPCAEDVDPETGVQPFAGFSFQKDVSVPGLNVADSQRFLRIFDKITQDRGLDSQNYECAECTKAIGQSTLSRFVLVVFDSRSILVEIETHISLW